MVIVGNWKIWRVKEKVITTLLLESNHAGITHINSILSLCVCVCVCVCACMCLCVCVCVYKLHSPFSLVLSHGWMWPVRTLESTRSENWPQILSLMESQSLEVEETRCRNCLCKVPGKWSSTLKAPGHVKLAGSGLAGPLLVLRQFRGCTVGGEGFMEGSGHSLLIPQTLRVPLHDKFQVTKPFQASASSSITWWYERDWLIRGQDLEQDPTAVHPQ